MDGEKDRNYNSVSENNNGADVNTHKKNEHASKGHRWIVHAFIIMIFDALLIAFSYYFALLMRFGVRQ